MISVPIKEEKIRKIRQIIKKYNLLNITIDKIFKDRNIKLYSWNLPSEFDWIIHKVNKEEYHIILNSNKNKEERLLIQFQLLGYYFLYKNLLDQTLTNDKLLFIWKEEDTEDKETKNIIEEVKEFWLNLLIPEEYILYLYKKHTIEELTKIFKTSENIIAQRLFWLWLRGLI